MIGWYHRQSGREFEQSLRDGEGQGGLACCSPWGHKELDMTQQLNNNSFHLTSELLRIELQSFQVFRDCLDAFLLLIFHVILFWTANILYMILKY